MSVLRWLWLVGALALQQSSLNPHDALARGILKELIEINTTDTAAGDNTKAAQAMAARLKAAGFPDKDVQVLTPAPRKGNLVARLRGSGNQKPILLLAHLDVVEARRDDWTMDPFTFTEQGNYFYGRGTSDDKAMAAIWVATLIHLKQEGFVPKRDIIVALTADEEGGDHNGVQWLLRNNRELIDAEFAINEGGGGELKNGKPILHAVQASEKMYQSFRLEVTNPGGHSSRPTQENAIYRLAEGLTRLSKYQFPARLTEVTSAYFKKMADLTTGQSSLDMRAFVKNPTDQKVISRLADSPYDNALIRTTCVATRLDAGHADNALPQTAQALVNCRLLPGDSAVAVRSIIARIVNDPKIMVTPIETPVPGNPSPLRPEVMGPIERITEAMWPGVPVVPIMSTGATDGLYLRNAGIPTYGVSGIFSDADDNREHGKDERIGMKQFYDAREFLYRLVKAYSS
jgi:acetylornithine deacetylase/succinyl-diaminopimelate desuccinylase-like protein